MITRSTNACREQGPARRPRLRPVLHPASGAGLIRGALGCPSNDELTQQDICAALLSTPHLDARHIEVDMTGAGVLLRGTVLCPGDRVRALRIARRIAAPRVVREELALLPSGDADGDDSHVARR